MLIWTVNLEIKVYSPTKSEWKGLIGRFYKLSEWINSGIGIKNLWLLEEEWVNLKMFGWFQFKIISIKYTIIVIKIVIRLVGKWYCLIIRLKWKLLGRHKLIE